MKQHINREDIPFRLHPNKGGLGFVTNNSLKTERHPHLVGVYRLRVFWAGLGFPQEIPRKGKILPIRRDFRDATGNWQCLYDHGTEIPQKTRGNTAEIPREVIFLAIAREFRRQQTRESHPSSGPD